MPDAKIRMDTAEQLRIVEQVELKASPATDEHLGSLVFDVEAVLRGVLDKLAAVRRHLQEQPEPDPAPQPGWMRRALEELADVRNWLGDPHDPRAVFCGPDTPYELALSALGRSGTM